MSGDEEPACASFPHPFSPFRLKSTEIRNRIFSTGHDTDLPRTGCRPRR